MFRGPGLREYTVADGPSLVQGAKPALDVGLPLLVVIASLFGQQDGAQTVWVLPMGDGEGPERAYGSGGGESGL